MQDQTTSLEALQDIRRLMNRSSRFLSLSGLSGIAAGAWALVGSFFAARMIDSYNSDYRRSGYTDSRYDELAWNLLILAALVLSLAVASAFIFTWRRARKQGLSIWDRSSRQLAINMMIPLGTGGLLILAMLQHSDWQYVSSLCLIFYGIALVNGSKYTVNDIRYLGVLQIILGLISTQYIGYGLYFWALGFGVLHIIYGFIMWWKNERPGSMDAAV